MSKLNDVDRDFSKAYDNQPAYGGCAYSLDFKDKRIKSLIKEKLANGFDRSESWSLDYAIAKFLQPRLSNLINQTVGCPAPLDSIEEWKTILLEIKEAMDLVVKYTENTITEEENNNVEKGLQTFKKWFSYLWW